MKSLKCPNPDCSLCGKANAGNISRHGFYKVKSGKRRRYRCSCCGATFCGTKGTAYYRLQHPPSTFDEVAHLSVEGLNKSAIARVKGIAWNTVDRWLEKAAACCREFNDQYVSDIAADELQAEEIRTIAPGKDDPVWIFTTMAVWSRLWMSVVVGRRSYRSTYSVLKDTRSRMKLASAPLIVTDGFEYYAKVVRRLFGWACLYAQVLKTRRNDRIAKIERKTVIGAEWRFDEALSQSEDSSTLNTSFIERLHLTIRGGSAYLHRRTICHARSKDRLREHLELQRFYYNFVRGHRSLKFGSEVRPPATQAGLASRPLTFREVLSLGGVL